MSTTNEGVGDRDEIAEWIAAARDTMARVSLCWLVTIGSNGRPNARIVSPIPALEDDDEWTIWFLTSKSSRKASDIRRDDRVTLGYQCDADSAYVTLGGRAAIVNDRSEIARRWSRSWNTVFPGGAEDLDAVFLRTVIDR